MQEEGGVTQLQICSFSLRKYASIFYYATVKVELFTISIFAEHDPVEFS